MEKLLFDVDLSEEVIIVGTSCRVFKRKRGTSISLATGTDRMCVDRLLIRSGSRLGVQILPGFTTRQTIISVGCNHDHPNNVLDPYAFSLAASSRHSQPPPNNVLADTPLVVSVSVGT